MTRYQCEVCGGEGYVLKSGYNVKGISFTVLCPDHLIKFEFPKHQFSH